MSRNDKTVYDSGATMPENDATVYDSDETIAEGSATVLDAAMKNDATVLEDSVDTMPDNASLTDGTTTEAADGITIEKGSMILDTYRVEADSIKGGMGNVWRVHHMSWNTDLAMKQPQAKVFLTEQHKENFVHECEAWINLGLHPHIVSCYYVREIGGIPTIFSEWMDGGSLKNITEDKSLYDSSAEERILDIAIQFARGLHYAHEQGLIHQDVKPDNLLLSQEGEAKVADFGIARARAALTPQYTENVADATMISDRGGCTMAYCSPEQFNRKNLTRRTDIYSWAVSVMEMYLAVHPWPTGVIAGAACEEYFPIAKIAIPETMKALLKECMNADEAQRPHDFTVVEARLLQIYKDETGAEYDREEPKAAADTADSLNNRALSFLDIGKPEKAEKCWTKALALNPNHAESVYNNALHDWRSGKINVRMCFKKVDNYITDKKSWKKDFFVASLYYEQFDDENAMRLLDRALKKSPDNSNIKKLMQIVSERNFRWDYQTHQIDCSAISNLHPDNNHVLIGHNTGKIGLYNLANRKVVKLFSGNPIDVPVQAIEISRCGNFALSSSYKHREKVSDVKLWNMQSGVCMHIFKLKFKATSLYYTKDNLLMFSDGGNVEYYSAEGICTYSNLDTTNIITLTISPSKNLIFYGRHQNDNIKSLFIIDRKTKELVQEFNFKYRLGDLYRSLDISTISHDDTQLLYSTENYAIVLVDIASKQSIHSLSGHTFRIEQLYITKDGQYVISAARDSTIRVWETNTGKCIHIFPCSQISFTLSPCERYISYLDCDKKMAVRNVLTGQYFKSLKIDMNVSYSQDSRYLFAKPSIVFKDRAAFSRHQLPPFNANAQYILSQVKKTAEMLVVESKKNKIICDAEDALKQMNIPDALSVLNIARNKPEFAESQEYYWLSAQIKKYCCTISLRSWQKDINFDSLPYEFTCASIDSCGKFILAACKNSIYVWNIFESKLEEKINAPCHFGRDALFTPDGRYVLGNTEPTGMMLFDIKTRRIVTRFLFPSNIDFTCFNRNGEYLLTVERTKSNKVDVMLWRVKTGECLRVFSEKSVSKIAFSNDTQSIITEVSETIDKKKIKKNICWDVQTGKEIFHCRCDNDFTGYFLLDNCSDGIYYLKQQEDLREGYHPIKTIENVRLINIKDSTCKIDFKMSVYITEAFFSPDDRFLFTICRDKKIRVWSLETYDCVMTFTTQNGFISNFYINQSGTVAIAKNNNNQTGKNSYSSFKLDWECEFPGWADCSDEAHTYINKYLKQNPGYADKDFEGLVADLQNKGYGWIRPVSIKKLSIISEHIQKSSVEATTINEQMLSAIKRADDAYIDGKIYNALNILQKAQKIQKDIAYDYIHKCKIEIVKRRNQIGRYCNRKRLISVEFDDSFSQCCEKNRLSSVFFTQDGKNILCRYTSNDNVMSNKFAFWNIKSNEISHTFALPENISHILCLNQSSTLILCTAEEHTLQIFSTETGQLIKSLSGHTEKVKTGDFSPNGFYVFTTAEDSTSRLWNIRTGKCMRIHCFAPSQCGKGLFSPDGTKYCFNDEDMSWSLWDVQSGKRSTAFKSVQTEIRIQSAHQPTPIYVCNLSAVSSDFRYAVATFEYFSQVELWDMQNGISNIIKLGSGYSRERDSDSCIISPDSSFVLCKTLSKTYVYSIKTNQIISTINMKLDSICSNAMYALDMYQRLYHLNWEYEFPGWADWDEGARPYLEIFLTLHPEYTKEDFDNLITDLQNRGYGWLRPEGVRAKLEEMAQSRLK